MGCYLSAPDDRVFITEGKGKDFRYSTASCQGWRREQEDAEDCLPYFDDDASLFILCDGHGGAEVAKYTVKHFPDFLKNHAEYKRGNYGKALEEAFIDFDVRLRSDEVLEELERIAMDSRGNEESDGNEKTSNGHDREQTSDDAKMDVKEDDQVSESTSANAAGCSSAMDSGAGSSSGPGSSAGPSSSNGPTSVAEDVDSETLRKEASIPIEELINKYTGPSHIKGKVQSLRHGSLNLAGSPVIRPSQRDGGCEDDAEVGSSEQVEGGDACEQPGSSKTSGESSSSEPKAGFHALIKETLKQYFMQGCDGEEDDDEDDDDDSEFDASDMDDDDDDDDDSEDEEENDESDSDDDEDGDDELDEDAETSGRKRSKKLRKKHRDELKNSTSSSSDETDDDQEDEDDIDAGEESGGSEEEDDYFIDPNSIMAKKLKAANRSLKPGIDSGCTVVVALVKSGTLYVASAGDSRCILVEKGGLCLPMSADHKPEDLKEIKRIKKANGTVVEGRVNGGLNLSRAFGDFNYKDKNLDPREQMITALPDVRIQKLDFNNVEYILLACDGIWNSMSNRVAAQRIHEWAESMNLTEICVRLFRECIARSSDGDGTGCDNMTCILARYGETKEDSQASEQNNLKTGITTTKFSGDRGQSGEELDADHKPVTTDDMSLTSAKRSAESDDGSDSKRVCKRLCIHLLKE